MFDYETKTLLDGNVTFELQVSVRAKPVQHTVLILTWKTSSKDDMASTSALMSARSIEDCAPRANPPRDCFASTTSHRPWTAL